MPRSADCDMEFAAFFRRSCVVSSLGVVAFFWGGFKESKRYLAGRDRERC